MTKVIVLTVFLCHLFISDSFKCKIPRIKSLKFAKIYSTVSEETNNQYSENSISYKAPDSNPFLPLLPFVLFARRNTFSLLTIFLMLPVQYPINLIALAQSRKIGVRLLALGLAMVFTATIIIRDLLYTYDKQQKERYSVDSRTARAGSADRFSMGMGTENVISNDQFSSKIFKTFRHTDDDSLWGQSFDPTRDNKARYTKSSEADDLWGQSLESSFDTSSESSRYNDDNLWGQSLTSSDVHQSDRLQRGDYFRSTDELYGQSLRGQIRLPAKKIRVSNDEPWNRGFQGEEAGDDSIDQDDIWNQSLTGGLKAEVTMVRPSSEATELWSAAAMMNMDTAVSEQDDLWGQSLSGAVSNYKAQPKRAAKLRPTEDDLWNQSLFEPSPPPKSISAFDTNAQDLWDASLGQGTLEGYAPVSKDDDMWGSSLGVPSSASLLEGYGSASSPVSPTQPAEAKENKSTLTILTAAALGFGLGGPIGGLISATLSVGLVSKQDRKA